MNRARHTAAYRVAHAMLAQAVGRANPVAVPRPRISPRTGRFVPRGYVTAEDLRAELQRQIAATPAPAIPTTPSPEPYWNRD